jgi:hypothetical protein
VTRNIVPPPLRSLHLSYPGRRHVRLLHPRRPLHLHSLCLIPHSDRHLHPRIVGTPDHPSPAPAPSSVFSPATPREPASPPHAAVEAKKAPDPLPPAPSPEYTSPTPPEPPTPPRNAVQAATTSALPPTSPGPPTPPPWPEAYIFSTDPDRIVCRKCCNRHYNFRWYSHCFMCN